MHIATVGLISAGRQKANLEEEVRNLARSRITNDAFDFRMHPLKNPVPDHLEKLIRGETLGLIHKRYDQILYLWAL